jgi:hypothetical protein
MNNKNEIIKYKNFYQIGFETCEFISEKNILRSDNGLVDVKTAYPLGIKEIEAKNDNLNKFWKRIDQIGVWNWENEYDNKIAPTDGHQWKLSLRNKEGKSIDVKGYEMYPTNFNKFINVLNKLFEVKIKILK